MSLHIQSLQLYNYIHMYMKKDHVYVKTCQNLVFHDDHSHGHYYYCLFLSRLLNFYPYSPSSLTSRDLIHENSAEKIS